MRGQTQWSKASMLGYLSNPSRPRVTTWDPSRQLLEKTLVTETAIQWMLASTTRARMSNQMSPLQWCNNIRTLLLQLLLAQDLPQLVSHKELQRKRQRKDSVRVGRRSHWARIVFSRNIVEGSIRSTQRFKSHAYCLKWQRRHRQTKLLKRHQYLTTYDRSLETKQWSTLTLQLPSFRFHLALKTALTCEKKMFSHPPIVGLSRQRQGKYRQKVQLLQAKSSNLLTRVEQGKLRGQLIVDLRQHE